MEPEEIIKNIDQVCQQSFDVLHQLNDEKRVITLKYIKDLEEKKIIEIKNALQALSINHN